MEKQRALLDQIPDQVTPADGSSATPTPPLHVVAAADLQDIDDNDTIPIDPALLSFEAALMGEGDIAHMLVDGAVPSDGDLMTSSSRVAAAVGGRYRVAPVVLLSGQPAGTDDDPCGILMVERDTFSHFFATINVKRFTYGFALGFQKGYDVGSAEDQRLAQLQCPNENNGCPYTRSKATDIMRHMKACRYISPEYSDSLVFACNEPGYLARFPTEDGLGNHRRVIHGFKPRTCPKPDCTSDEVFETPGSLNSHIAQVHTDWVPRTCPVPGCSRNNYVYELCVSFRGHMRTAHRDKLDIEEYAQYMPPPRRRRSIPPAIRHFKPQQCSYSGCIYPYIFTTYRNYFTYTEKHHGVGEDEMVLLVLADPPLPDTLGGLPVKRKRSIYPAIRHFKLQQCSYSGCIYQHVFRTYKNYLIYTEKYYGIGEDEMVPLVLADPPSPDTLGGLPAKWKRSIHPAIRHFKLQQCSYSGCIYQYVFRTYKNYLIYAEKHYGIGEDEMVPLVLADPPLPDTLGGLPVKRKRSIHPAIRHFKLQ
jgi:hypothetical protein